MFGNDITPESDELGIEYSLNTYLIYHFKTFKNNNLYFVIKIILILKI